MKRFTVEGSSMRAIRWDRARPACEREAGFTLTELMVSLVIFGILTSVALPGFNRFLRSLDLNNQVQVTASMMRVARQKAITENNNYIVYWDDTVKGFGWFDDNDNNGVKGGMEPGQAPVSFPSWVTIANSSTNPFTSPIITFFPNGSASQSGTCIFTNSDGYSRSLSVVRPTGMVTAQ